MRSFVLVVGLIIGCSGQSPEQMQSRKVHDHVEATATLLAWLEKPRDWEYEAGTFGWLNHKPSKLQIRFYGDNRYEALSVWVRDRDVWYDLTDKFNTLDLERINKKARPLMVELRKDPEYKRQAAADAAFKNTFKK